MPKVRVSLALRLFEMVQTPFLVIEDENEDE